MKSSDVYLLAAELLVTGHPTWAVAGYSCLAIEAAQGDLRGQYGKGDEVGRYAAAFKPITGRYAWGDLWGAERHGCRVLALLFMHQIALDEEAA